MAMDGTLNFRIGNDLKRKFLKITEAQNVSAGGVLVRFISDYVDEHKDLLESFIHEAPVAVFPNAAHLQDWAGFAKKSSIPAALFFPESESDNVRAAAVGHGLSVKDIGICA